MIRQDEGKKKPRSKLGETTESDHHRDSSATRTVIACENVGVGVDAR